mgnify:CR=1 FL=1
MTSRNKRQTNRKRHAAGERRNKDHKVEHQKLIASLAFDGFMLNYWSTINYHEAFAVGVIGRMISPIDSLD